MDALVESLTATLLREPRFSQTSIHKDRWGLQYRGLPDLSLPHIYCHLLYAAQMATAAIDPSTPALPSAHIQVRTCILCRQRRVKCDRQMPCCSSCVRCDANCVYPPGRGRAPKRPRRDVVGPQVSERLSRLESIISQLGASSTFNGALRLTSSRARVRF